MEGWRKDQDAGVPLVQEGPCSRLLTMLASNLNVVVPQDYRLAEHEPTPPPEDGGRPQKKCDGARGAGPTCSAGAARGQNSAHSRHDETLQTVWSATTFRRRHPEAVA